MATVVAPTAKLESQLRTFLRRRASGRNSMTVTADDAYAFFNKKNVDLTPGARANLISRVLSENFLWAGTTRSTRPEAKGREITVWMY